MFLTAEAYARLKDKLERLAKATTANVWDDTCDEVKTAIEVCTTQMYDAVWFANKNPTAPNQRISRKPAPTNSLQQEPRKTRVPLRLAQAKDNVKKAFLALPEEKKRLQECQQSSEPIIDKLEKRDRERNLRTEHPCLINGLNEESAQKLQTLYSADKEKGVEEILPDEDKPGSQDCAIPLTELEAYFKTQLSKQCIDTTSQDAHEFLDPLAAAPEGAKGIALYFTEGDRSAACNGGLELCTIDGKQAVKLSHMAYADDLQTVANSREGISRLHQVVKAFLEWTLLEANPSKCATMEWKVGMASPPVKQDWAAIRGRRSQPQTRIARAIQMLNSKSSMIEPVAEGHLLESTKRAFVYTVDTEGSDREAILAYLNGRGLGCLNRRVKEVGIRNLWSEFPENTSMSKTRIDAGSDGSYLMKTEDGFAPDQQHIIRNMKQPMAGWQHDVRKGKVGHGKSVASQRTASSVFLTGPTCLNAEEVVFAVRARPAQLSTRSCEKLFFVCQQRSVWGSSYLIALGNGPLAHQGATKEYPGSATCAPNDNTIASRTHLVILSLMSQIPSHDGIATTRTNRGAAGDSVPL
ncbi:hypothetical protein EBH_0055620 [Eimeria brunetti]|uniref:Uncharacterized protein n=1 Tax=Eimeria brunetti TaxID=51314 RepID=U6LSX6_9EIME|nr:hypothetical protein EBH_0055620 [Eimeria brunetti]